jgi:hypothetical protein
VPVLWFTEHVGAVVLKLVNVDASRPGVSSSTSSRRRTVARQGVGAQASRMPRNVAQKTAPSLSQCYRDLGQTHWGAVVSPSGLLRPPGFEVKFPAQVGAVDRVNMWLDGGNIRLGMWPAELKPQYEPVYSDPTKVEALIDLADLPNWDFAANFHLAYWLAATAKRWYPTRQLSAPEYLRQCIDGFRDQRPGRRPREDLDDKSFRRWLIQRRYASESELATLDVWRDALPRDHFDIRPSV